VGAILNGGPALESVTPVLVRATLPTGARGEARVRIASASGLLFAKAQIPFSPRGSDEAKHHYDVYWPGARLPRRA